MGCPHSKQLALGHPTCSCVHSYTVLLLCPLHHPSGSLADWQLQEPIASAAVKGKSGVQVTREARLWIERGLLHKAAQRMHEGKKPCAFATTFTDTWTNFGAVKVEVNPNTEIPASTGHPHSNTKPTYLALQRGYQYTYLSEADPTPCWVVSCIFAVKAGAENPLKNGSPILRLWVTSPPIHFTAVVSCVLCRTSAAGD